MCGCEHRPMEDIELGHFIRIYFDEEIRNVTFGFYDETKDKPEYSSPEMMRVVLCNPEDGKVVSERYLHDSGRDEKGYYIQGYITAPDGEYNLLAYNYDTEQTHVSQEQSYSGMTAYTNPINESDANRLVSRNSDADKYADEVIRYQPDHFFVTSIENVKAVSSLNRDTIKTDTGEDPVAKSIVQTYYIQVNVKGVEYVRSAVALISGMSGSKTIYNREMVYDDVSSIYFGLKNGMSKSRSNEDVYVAYASFNTFGKLPDVEGYIEITFEFNTKYNTVQTETYRITDMFQSQMVKEKQWIIIDKTIEIIPPEGTGTGGMQPGVSEWEEVEGSTTI